MSRRQTSLGHTSQPPNKKSEQAGANRAVSLGKRGWLTGLFLALVVILVYWPVTRHDFVNYDDAEYVTENAQVQSGLTPASLQWALGHTVSGNWHPVTMLSHMLDCQLFGLQAGGHHLTSLMLHALNTVLVFLLLHRLTGALWRSALVAALFGLHPLHVESVAWVAERKDVLSACFGWLALLAYARYAQESQTGGPKPKIFYGLSLLALALGLLSKPMLVTWPFVLLLLDYWPLGRFKTQRAWPLVREKIPFMVLALAVCVLTFEVQKQDGAMEAADGLPFGARCGNALIAYCRYLGKAFWPTRLAVFYPHPGYWPPGLVLLAALLLAGLSALFWRLRHRQPFLLMGWLWFAGTLVPVIGLVQVGGQAMADRYTYIPLAGVLILTVWGAHEFTRRWPHHQLVRAVAGAAGVLLCLGVTQQQLGCWQDSETLFRQAIAVTENNALAHGNLGMALDKKNRVEEAIREYREAIRLRPEDVKSRNNLGIDLVKNGELDEGIRQYQEAIRLKPDFADAHFDLAIAFRNQGQLDQAITQYQEVIRLKPEDAKAQNNLGNVLLSQGRTEEAVSRLQAAIRLKPDDAEPRDSLGVALLKLGRTDEAISQFQEAIRLNPDDAKAHNNLGNVLLNQGRTDAAVSQYQEAIRLKPDYARAHNNLGLALAKTGDKTGAISEFQEAIRFNPNYPEAQDNLDRELAK
jgi:tetratricopeptide (TPR) repeat protein